MSLSRETSRSDECETPAANKDSEPLNAASEDLVEVAREDEVISNDDTTFARDEMSTTVMESFLNQNTRERTGKSTKTQRGFNGQKSKENQYRLEENLSKTTEHFESDNHYEEDGFNETESLQKSPPFPVRGMHQEMAEPQYAVDRSETPSCSEKNKYLSRSSRDQDQASASNVSSVVQNAFNRMRSKRNSMEIATVTIGPNTTTAILGSSSSKRRRVSNSPSALESSPAAHDFSTQNFSSSIRAFAAPDTQLVQPARQQLATRYASRHPDSEEAALSATDDSSDPCTDSEHENERHHLSASVAEGSQPMNDRLSDHSALNEEGLHDESSDSEFLDEEDKKLKEDIKVARLIYQAEEKLARPSENNVERAYQILEKCGRKDAPAQLMQIVQTSDYQINRQMQSLEKCTSRSSEADDLVEPAVPSDEESAEKLLSLTISKEDFSRMHIVGQFNLGFILTTRQGVTNGPSLSSAFDEIFIIDQHASDEKYNFERLQSSTVVQNQRLVRPHTLDLTAIEEEIILENNETLLKNGFVVSVDTSGDEPVGQRCKLLSLPMSREVTFDTTDLEELIALLADSPHVSSATILSLEKTNSNIPRPSKVRRMFAMRACRSSVMIGKSLNKRQMQRLVGHMGEIDKPWNCPHGRPTMRHVLSLGAWEGWREGQGLIGMGEEYDEAVPDWRRFLDRRRRKVENKEMEKEEEMDEEEDNESENYDNDDEEDDDKETEDWKETSAEERPN